MGRESKKSKNKNCRDEKEKDSDKSDSEQLETSSEEEDDENIEIHGAHGRQERFEDYRFLDYLAIYCFLLIVTFFIDRLIRQYNIPSIF
ncbi:unnamed protein product [Caenorhabditis bovis]|uniref:Uncharacterized protein n=1 Tax=Caenorhabditis bovis TaxID=2654633 RepID=A0A8S1EJ10_9PELO|nr:unnamed protein product [Caenorhabditis bovis]